MFHSHLHVENIDCTESTFVLNGSIPESEELFTMVVKILKNLALMSDGPWLANTTFKPDIIRLPYDSTCNHFYTLLKLSKGQSSFLCTLEIALVSHCYLNQYGFYR